MKRFLSLAVLLTFGGMLRGDIVPAGHKRVATEYVLDNLGDYPDYWFYLYGGHYTKQGLTAGEPFSFPAASIAEGSSKLSAVPRAAAEAGDDRAPGAIHRHRPPFTGRYTISLSDPAERIVVHYRVIVANGTLDLQEAAYQRYDRNGTLLPELVLIASGPESRRWYVSIFSGIALLLLMGLVIRNRAAAARSAARTIDPAERSA